MPDKRRSRFAIVRVNRRTYVSGGVVAVIEGRTAAENRLRDLERGQAEEDRFAGWQFFLEETDLEPGLDPKEATRLRQAHLDDLDSEG
jgi:hypothetical protein